jgi:hypothetical protein
LLQRAAQVFSEDLDVPAHKLSEAARRVIGKAFDEARRRGHMQLTTAHLFFAAAASI